MSSCRRNTIGAETPLRKKIQAIHLKYAGAPARVPGASPSRIASGGQTAINREPQLCICQCRYQNGTSKTRSLRRSGETTKCKGSKNKSNQEHYRDRKYVKHGA